MDNFLDLVRKRQSTRAYSRQPVEEEKLKRALEAARLAPSACNAQPWHFIVVDDEALRKQVARALTTKVLGLNTFAQQVPVFVVLVTEPMNFTAKLGGMVKSKQYSMIDLGIATEHFCLQAGEDGLGTCIIGWFDEERIKDLLGIPEKKRLHVVISVGYPPENYRQRKKKRKPLDEIYTRNGYAQNR